MRQLPDLLNEKIKQVGGKAELGRKLGGLTGQAILTYVNGKMPSLSIAIHWKKSFKENLIDLLFEENPQSVVKEAEEKYHTAQDDLNDCRKDLLAMIKERDRLRDELETLKKFNQKLRQ